MNYDQYTGVIRAIVPVICAELVAHSWLSASAAADVSVAMIALAAAIWSIFNNKTGKTIT
jgi:hypothetical protein